MPIIQVYCNRDGSDGKKVIFNSPPAPEDVSSLKVNFVTVEIAEKDVWPLYALSVLYRNNGEFECDVIHQRVLPSGKLGVWFTLVLGNDDQARSTGDLRVTIETSDGEASATDVDVTVQA